MNFESKQGGRQGKAVQNVGQSPMMNQDCRRRTVGCCAPMSSPVF